MILVSGRRSMMGRAHGRTFGAFLRLRRALANHIQNANERAKGSDQRNDQNR
jgi:hypothetical protein